MGEQADGIEDMLKDPAMLNQMTGFWKQLDEMHSSDEKSYKEFIEKQKKEFDEETKRLKAEKDKQRIVQGSPVCSFKILPSKVIV